PDRVARRREAGGRRGVMVGGRGVKLAPASGVTEPELFLCVDVDGRGVEALVRQASAVQRDWLPAALTSATVEVAFDAATERVTARRPGAGGGPGPPEARPPAGGRARGAGADSGARRQPPGAALRVGPAAGPRGAHPGDVRPARHAARRRRPRRGAAAPAGAEL